MININNLSYFEVFMNQNKVFSDYQKKKKKKFLNIR